jgi:competence protein ComGC
MKLRHHRQTNQGMTLVEAVVVIFVIAVLAMVLVPALLAPNHPGRARISCTYNLKQFALAAKIWAGDHNDQYPMEASVSNGGTLELMNTPDAWKAFQVLSNELSTPTVLGCPEVFPHGGYATNFDENLKNKISYFIGLGLTDTNANGLLAGDDNFLNQGSPVKPGLFEITSGTPVGWDSSRHTDIETYAWIYRKSVSCGNVALGDGSVQSLNNSTLRDQMRRTGLATNRLVIP